MPEDAQPLTPVFLMATAGMRLIDSTLADAVLEACRQVLQSSNFRFQAEWASIIPGYQVRPNRQSSPRAQPAAPSSAYVGFMAGAIEELSGVATVRLWDLGRRECLVGRRRTTLPVRWRSTTRRKRWACWSWAAPRRR